MGSCSILDMQSETWFQLQVLSTYEPCHQGSHLTSGSIFPHLQCGDGNTYRSEISENVCVVCVIALSTVPAQGHQQRKPVAGVTFVLMHASL